MTRCPGSVGLEKNIEDWGSNLQSHLDRRCQNEVSSRKLQVPPTRNVNTQALPKPSHSQRTFRWRIGLVESLRMPYINNTTTSLTALDNASTSPLNASVRHLRRYRPQPQVSPLTRLPHPAVAGDPYHHLPHHCRSPVSMATVNTTPSTPIIGENTPDALPLTLTLNITNADSSLTRTHCDLTSTPRTGLVGHLRFRSTEAGEPGPEEPMHTHRTRLNCHTAHDHVVIAWTYSAICDSIKIGSKTPQHRPHHHKSLRQPIQQHKPVQYYSPKHKTGTSYASIKCVPGASRYLIKSCLAGINGLFQLRQPSRPAPLLDG
ncbi:hypothetical protein SprV_0100174400 [Sparganum proliferum]